MIAINWFWKKNWPGSQSPRIVSGASRKTIGRPATPRYTCATLSHGSTRNPPFPMPDKNVSCKHTMPEIVYMSYVHIVEYSSSNKSSKIISWKFIPHQNSRRVKKPMKSKVRSIHSCWKLDKAAKEKCKILAPGGRRLLKTSLSFKDAWWWKMLVKIVPCHKKKAIWRRCGLAVQLVWFSSVFFFGWNLRKTSRISILCGSFKLKNRGRNTESWQTKR